MTQSLPLGTHTETLHGFQIHRARLDPGAQQRLLEQVRDVVAAAPLFTPETRGGKAMSVRMTSAGKYGWFSDRSGYRYLPQHPSGSPWPEIPAVALDLWRDLVDARRLPDCCLINFYDRPARMGLHQDADEADFSWPVLSVSLGDSALFRVGGVNRRDPTASTWLESGDVVLFGGAARRAYHGIDRIRFGTSALLRNHGRINLTLRVVD